MEQIIKHSTQNIRLKDRLKRIGDLINMDGPMLVLFKDIFDGELYLFDWVDADDVYNRWLVYPVSLYDLADFIDRKISYKSVFEKNTNDVYVTDISVDNLQQYEIFKLESIPNSYKPDVDNLFDVRDAKNFDSIYKLVTYYKFCIVTASKSNFIGNLSINIFNYKFDLVLQKKVKKDHTTTNNLARTSLHLFKTSFQQNVRENRELSKVEKLVV